MVNEAGIRHQRRPATRCRRNAGLLKLIAMLGALVLLGACGNTATGNDAAGLTKSSVIPAPAASIKSMGFGAGAGAVGPLGIIAGLAQAIASGVSAAEAQAQLVALSGDFQQMQTELAAIQAAQNQDFEALLEAEDRQTYELAVSDLQTQWIDNIDGALGDLQSIVTAAQNPSPNPQVMADYVTDFTNFVSINQQGSLNEAGNALMQQLIYNSGTSSPPVWGMAWQAIQQSQLVQYKNTLLTSNSSAQFQAMSNGWLGIMATLQLVLTNYWNLEEALPSGVATPESQAAAAAQLQASGIALQIQALQAAQPKLIPNYTLIDPSTQLMWATFGQLLGGGDNLSAAIPPTSTNAAGEQTGLGDLLNQVNGSATLAQGGWANFPVGVPGQGSGPAGSGLQINSWSFPNVYSWLMPNDDVSFTEHAGVQFGGNGYATGLESQLNGAAPGQPMMNTLQAASNPSVFPYANPSCWDYNASGMWVASNVGYQAMMPDGESELGSQDPGIVGGPVSWDGESLYYCAAAVTLLTLVKAADYQWVPQTP